MRAATFLTASAYRGMLAWCLPATSVGYNGIKFHFPTGLHPGSIWKECLRLLAVFGCRWANAENNSELMVHLGCLVFNARIRKGYSKGNAALRLHSKHLSGVFALRTWHIRSASSWLRLYMQTTYSSSMKTPVPHGPRATPRLETRRIGGTSPQGSLRLLLFGRQFMEPGSFSKY